MTYQEACKTAKTKPNHSYEYDAGNGCRGRVHYCPMRGRLIKQVTRDGSIWF